MNYTNFTSVRNVDESMSSYDANDDSRYEKEGDSKLQEAVLASGHIQRRIHDHTGIDLDFLAIALQNSKRNIKRECTFIWGRTNGPFILTQDKGKVKVPELCEKLLTLIKGAFVGDKRDEYEAKKVASPVDIRSVELLEKIAAASAAGGD